MREGRARDTDADVRYWQSNGLRTKVKVNLVNAGTGTTEYTKLQNAIKAGSGAPDIAQIEYYAVPQFALAER